MKLNFLLKRNEESKESQGSVEKKIYFPFVVVAFKEENQIEAMKCDNKLITLEYKLSEKVRV